MKSRDVAIEMAAGNDLPSSDLYRQQQLKLETEFKTSKRNLSDVPTIKELNRYVIDMAPFYFDIGLELDVLNSQLKLIRNDPSLPDLKEKCCKMLEVWLENDTSATWMKLCDALCEIGQSVLAEQIKSA